MTYIRNSALKTIPLDACGIYRITNKLDGKFYIGSAGHMRRRVRTHLQLLRLGTHTNPHLQRAFARDGEESFVFSVELLCEKKDLLNREQEILDQLTPHNDTIGYNISPSAYSGPRVVFTDEMRAVISARFKGKKKSAEHRFKIGESQKIRQCAPEKRKQIGESLKKFFSDPANREAQSKRQTGLKRRGTPCSVERKKALSEARLGVGRPDQRKYTDEQVRGWIEMRNRGMTWLQITLETKMDAAFMHHAITRYRKENPS